MYSSEIERRAIEILKRHAEFSLKCLGDAQAEIAYLQKWNVRMVAVVAVLLGVIAWMVSR
jgi:hypothetical protein